VALTATGYTVELAVPWSAVGGAPAPDSPVGLDVANNDSDTAGGSSSTTGRGWRTSPGSTVGDR